MASTVRHRRLRARKPPPIRPPIQGGPVAVLQSPTQVTGVKMKLIAWAIALAAAGLTPAAAQAPQAAQPNGAGIRVRGQRARSECSGTATPESAVTATETGVGHAIPEEHIGVPIRAGTGIQEQVTEIGQGAANFHNIWLLCALRDHQRLRSRPARLDDHQVPARRPTRRRRAPRTTPRSRSPGRWSRC